MRKMRGVQHDIVIGARLRAARGKRPAQEIAATLGVATPTLYRWESGDITIPPHRYGQIAFILGAPWHELFAPAPTETQVA